MSNKYDINIKKGESKSFPAGRYRIHNKSCIDFIDITGGVNSTMFFSLGPDSKAIVDDSNGIKLIAESTTEDVQVTLECDKLQSYDLHGKIVCLDAGHGGKDPGAVNGLHAEKDIALNIVLKLRDMLSEAGAKVILTRDDDSYPHLSSRANIANNSGSDVFVSVHLNSANNKAATGYEILIFKKNGRSAELGKRVLDNLGTVVAWPNRKLKERPDLTVLAKTSMPAILVEVGFISNDNELKELLKCSTQTMLAKAIFNGMVEYYDSQNKETSK